LSPALQGFFMPLARPGIAGADRNAWHWLAAIAIIFNKQRCYFENWLVEGQTSP